MASTQLGFQNFTANEIDSIVVYHYSRNNHSSPLDSNIYLNQPYSQNSNSSASISTYTKFDWNSDYKVKLLSTEQEYWLTNFETGKEGCNSCFPYRPQSDYYTVLRSYRVNDKYSPASYGSIVITK